MNKVFLFLNKYTNIGYVGFLKILEYLDNNILKFFDLNKSDFIKMGFSYENIENVFRNLKIYNYEEEFEKINKLDIKMCNIFDENYPHLLKKIIDPPLMFYYKGLLKEKENNLAIVGSRKYSSYGDKVAKEFSEYLSDYFSIVSGFAIGIDSISHNGAVLKKNRTIAVMGVGLDSCYPYINRDLVNKILENNGLLISEFALESFPLKSNFPRRNRIISGLSQGVLVIEAGLKSGTFITAGLALEQGRDLFVIPGSIYSEFSEGTNELIKKGANFVTKPEDIIEILNVKCGFFKDYNKKEIKENKNLKIMEGLNEKEKNIFNLLSYDFVSMEDIFLKTNMEIKELNSLLTLMEIKGLIKNVGAGYIRI